MALLGLRPHAAISPLVLALDLVLTLVFIVLTARAFRRLPRVQGLWMVCLLLPALVKVSADGPLVSVSRYVLAVFPGFAMLGWAGRQSWFHRPWLYVSLGLQALMAALFFEWAWVA